MDISEYVDINTAVELLKPRIPTVNRVTLSAWVRDMYLPGVRYAGGITTLIPKAALALFEKPGGGRYKKRENLQRGIAIAIRVIGKTQVPATIGVVGAICPRCGHPWVINGSQPVLGREADLCCCNLDCLYIGADFIAQTDTRAVRSADGTEVTFSA